MVKSKLKPKKSAIANERTSSSRQKRLTKKQAKQKNKKELSSRTSLPSSIKLTKNAISMIKKHWRTLAGKNYIQK